MKRLSLFPYLLILLLSCKNEDNIKLLSPIWEISTNDTPAIGQKTNNKIQTANLLLSWERQGYSWLNGDCTLGNIFHLPLKRDRYELQFSLQCDVNEIFINDILIGGNVSNTFWTNRGQQTTIKIPDSCLVFGGENTIKITVSNLSYTGGKSFNYCQIIPHNQKLKAHVRMNFNQPGHLYISDTAQMYLDINSKSSHPGIIHFLLRTDDKDTISLKTYKIKTGVNQLRINLKKYNLQPGIYECTTILNNGTFAGDVQWFAVSPEKIICNNQKVNGFDKYWEEALAELKNTEPKFNIYRIDSLCTANRNGYIVEMQSIQNITVRGYYFVPKGTAKYPVILHLPGYGYGFNNLGSFMDRKDNIAELAFCPRGHGISADVFNPWGEMALWAYKICDKKENVYRSIFLDCIRAVDFLISRPEIDTSRIGVIGGSQGGGLAIAMAGLYADYIDAMAYFDPFPCDTRHQKNIRTMIMDELKQFTTYYDDSCTVKKALEVNDFVDTKGFADKIQCPIYYAAALFDDDCPVHTGFAAYNIINSEKKYKIYPNDSHLAESGIYQDMFDYLLRQFHILKD